MKNHQENTSALPALLRSTSGVDTSETNSLCCAAAGVIGTHMLTPRELYRAQGFPDNYIIDTGHDGRKFSNKTQVMMVGNSVSPWPMMALVSANKVTIDDDLMGAAA